MRRREFLLSAAAVAGAATGPAARAAAPLKVAVMIPMSGPAALFGPSSKNCALMAADALNAAGGVLGRRVELMFGDAGVAPAEAAQTALRLWRGEGAEAVIGMHDSAVRDALVQLFDGHVPYVYTPVYEGGECAPGTYMTGETPEQQLRPVIPWLKARRKADAWYLIGNDYVWPRKTNAVARSYIQQAGGRVVGEEYVPFGVDNFDANLARIRGSGADAVLVTLVGGASVGFNKAFASFGLSDRALRLGTLIEENTLAGIGLADARNLYSSAGYFANLDTPRARAFAAAYAKRFGAHAPLLNGLAESAYEGFLLLAAVAARAGSLQVARMDPASEGAHYVGPRGPVTMHARHLQQNVYVADVGPAGFRVVKTFDSVASGQTCKA